jgi:hypothetical protein
MKKYTQSFIRFLEAATLGYHVGIGIENKNYPQ